MKKYNIIKYLWVLTLVFAFQACDDKNESEFDAAVEAGNLPWQASTEINLMGEEDKTSFVWLNDVITFDTFWGNNVVPFSGTISSAHPLADLQKIDFYITAHERNGFNDTDPVDMKGKMLTSISPVPESGTFNLSVSADDVYDLFKNDFQTGRPDAPLLETDKFIINWVITHTDGSTYDSSTINEPNAGRGISVKHEPYTPPGFVGKFKYEWVWLSDGGLSYGGVTVGETGTQTFTLDGIDGLVATSSTDNLMFGYNYGGPGSVTFDYGTGELNIIDTSWRAQKWKIVSIDGPNLTIDLEYYYSAGYDEYGTVVVTRTDGKDWPTDIWQPQAFPWGGKFDYEWLEVGPGSTWNKTVGDTGQISMTDIDPGVTWDVSNLLFDFYYGTSGTLTYDAGSGLTSVSGPQDEVWTISNVTATTLDISWTYMYTADYAEYGTVRLTRTDTKEWPANIYTE